MLMGYARVSTAEQNLDRQIEALTNAGVERRNLFCDKAPGAKASRPALDDMLSRLREGDTVVIVSLDRLARSTKQLLELSDKFSSQGVSLVSLKESIDTTSPQGRFFFTVMSAVAEFQREIIKETQREGLQVARKNGKRLGREPLDESKIDVAMELKLKGTMTVAEICSAVGISQASFYRYQRKQREC